MITLQSRNYTQARQGMYTMMCAPAHLSIVHGCEPSNFGRMTVFVDGMFPLYVVHSTPPSFWRRLDLLGLSHALPFGSGMQPMASVPLFSSNVQSSTAFAFAFPLATFGIENLLFVLLAFLHWWSFAGYLGRLAV